MAWCTWHVVQMVRQLLTEENPLWEGTPTELAQALGIDMKPNQLSTKLNVNARRLLQEQNISYHNSRTHAGRKITLRLINSKA